MMNTHPLALWAAANIFHYLVHYARPVILGPDALLGLLACKMLGTGVIMVHVKDLFLRSRIVRNIVLGWPTVRGRFAQGSM